MTQLLLPPQHPNAERQSLPTDQPQQHKHTCVCSKAEYHQSITQPLLPPQHANDVPTVATRGLPKRPRLLEDGTLPIDNVPA